MCYKKKNYKFAGIFKREIERKNFLYFYIFFWGFFFINLYLYLVLFTNVTLSVNFARWSFVLKIVCAVSVLLCLYWALLVLSGCVEISNSFTFSSSPHSHLYYPLSFFPFPSSTAVHKETRFFVWLTVKYSQANKHNSTLPPSPSPSPFQ